MIYINGTKASRSDLERLFEQGKRGEVTAKARTKKRSGVGVTHITTATAHTTKGENLSIVTEF